MMLRFVLAFALCAGAVQAQSVKLRDREIDALLSGNTVVGLWDGAPYRQFFDPDGSTILARPDGRVTSGEWRVRQEELQSIWPGDAAWRGWFVMEYAGQWFWVSKQTPPTPFEVREGAHLDPEP